MAKYRIRSTYEEGAEILRQLMCEQFPKLTWAQWLGAAQRTWHFKHGGLKPAYDLGIARALAGIDIERPMPPLWNEFDALAGVPMLVIRGANSDLLSADTVAAMRARRAHLDVIEVADQGHAPLLEGELVRQIVGFVDKCEHRRPTRTDDHSKPRSVVLLPARFVVEPAQQALALDRGRVHFRRAGAGRTRRAARGVAEVGIEVFKPQRPFRRELVFEADAGGPAARRGALRE